MITLHWSHEGEKACDNMKCDVPGQCVGIFEEQVTAQTHTDCQVKGIFKQTGDRSIIHLPTISGCLCNIWARMSVLYFQSQRVALPDVLGLRLLLERFLSRLYQWRTCMHSWGWESVVHNINHNHNNNHNRHHDYNLTRATYFKQLCPCSRRKLPSNWPRRTDQSGPFRRPCARVSERIEPISSTLVLFRGHNPERVFTQEEFY